MIDFKSFIRNLTGQKKTAAVAKERLQIIISHERGERNRPDYLSLLQKELLDVIAKYVNVKTEDVKVELGRKDNFSVLELNIVLPNSDAHDQEKCRVD